MRSSLVLGGETAARRVSPIIAEPLRLNTAFLRLRWQAPVSPISPSAMPGTTA